MVFKLLPKGTVHRYSVWLNVIIFKGCGAEIY